MFFYDFMTAVMPVISMHFHASQPVVTYCPISANVLIQVPYYHKKVIWFYMPYRLEGVCYRKSHMHWRR